MTELKPTFEDQITELRAKQALLDMPRTASCPLCACGFELEMTQENHDNWDRKCTTYQLGEAVEALRALDGEQLMEYSKIVFKLYPDEYGTAWRRTMMHATPAEIMAAVKEVTEK